MFLLLSDILLFLFPQSSRTKIIFGAERQNSYKQPILNQNFLICSKLLLLKLSTNSWILFECSRVKLHKGGLNASAIQWNNGPKSWHHFPKVCPGSLDLNAENILLVALISRAITFKRLDKWTHKWMTLFKVRKGLPPPRRRHSHYAIGPHNLVHICHLWFLVPKEYLKKLSNSYLNTGRLKAALWRNYQSEMALHLYHTL